MPAAIHINSLEKGSFPHFVTSKSQKNAFFTQKYLKRYISKMFLKNT
jgi:hypothetical protein